VPKLPVSQQKLNPIRFAGSWEAAVSMLKSGLKYIKHISHPCHLEPHSLACASIFPGINIKGSYKNKNKR
jgi:hypothetical protein